MPLKRGRFFTPSDTDGAPKVIIVDEQLAKKFWPNADPIGHRVYLPDKPEDIAKPGPTVTWMQVVGVVGAVKLKGLIEGENARAGAYYIPYAQQTSRGIGFAIRTAGDSAARPVVCQARPGDNRSGTAAVRCVLDARAGREVARTRARRR